MNDVTRVGVVRNSLPSVAMHHRSITESTATQKKYGDERSWPGECEWI